jgi:hypothetical protein
MVPMSKLCTAVALVLLAVFAFGVTPAVAAEATGVWKGEVTLPTGQVLPFVARLTQNGEQLIGTLDGIGGGASVQVRDGRVAGDRLTFNGVRDVNGQAVTFNYSATFTDADTLDFTIVRADGSAAPLKCLAKRATE